MKINNVTFDQSPGHWSRVSQWQPHMTAEGARSDAHKTAETTRNASRPRSNFFLSGPADTVVLSVHDSISTDAKANHGDNARLGRVGLPTSVPPAASKRPHSPDLRDAMLAKLLITRSRASTPDRLSLTTRSNMPHTAAVPTASRFARTQHALPSKAHRSLARALRQTLAAAARDRTTLRSCSAPHCARRLQHERLPSRPPQAIARGWGQRCPGLLELKHHGDAHQESRRLGGLGLVGGRDGLGTGFDGLGGKNAR